MQTLKALALLCLASLTAAPSLAQVSAGPVVNPTNGHRYSRLAPLNYAAARSQALAMGGDLATVSNATLNAWIVTNIARAGGNTTPCLIGFNDIALEGSFVWANGDPNFFTSWGSGEPNNQGNEDACTVDPATALWNDVPVSSALPAIVEIAGPIRVPQEYATIQNAIDAAIDGQTIVVAPGSYVGSFNYGSKKLAIRSQAGPLVTTIRTTGNGFGILIAGFQGPETVLDGFTIVADTTPNQLVNLRGNQTVRNCRFGAPALVAVASYGGSHVVSDCLIVGTDYAIAGNGSGTPTIQNCTIVGNGVAVDSEATGGAALIYKVNNSILYANTTLVAIQPGTDIRFTSCDTSTPYPGTGNISANPLFVSAPGPNGIYDLSDDYSLRRGSPCIDAGSNAARMPTSSGATLDFLGHTRLANDTSTAGSGPGAVVDMGALEFVGASCPADFDGDGAVDFFDYDAFVAAFEIGC